MKKIELYSYYDRHMAINIYYRIEKHLIFTIDSAQSHGKFKKPTSFFWAQQEQGKDKNNV